MSETANSAYAHLCARAERIAVIGESLAILNWDSSAMMPPGGAASRGDQIAVLAGLAHELATAPEVGEWLDAAESETLASDWDRANLALLRHGHTRATAVDAALVEATARASAACEKVWREARATSDFALVRPHLENVVALAAEGARALSARTGLSPYDALMDGFQRGIGAADVAPVFAAYIAFLREALPRALELQAARPQPLRPTGRFAAAAQEALCQQLSAAAGLDYRHARLDRSVHPFCGGTHFDVRITTRYDEEDFAQALMGVMHETGHGLYERGLPAAWARQPVGQAAGMGIHESQSLIVEMQSCRSDAYLAWLSPRLAECFGADPAFAPDNLARLWRRVERGLIRVDADEMTYPAHVILRFELEQGLISGDLPVADLPGAWNEHMRTLLGISPPNDAKGCLQDIHWYDGAFGYFPSYTLGAMAAAQLMAAARREVPDMDAALARGEISALTGWLGPRVHAQGSRFGFNDLLLAATGKTLDPADFQNHLTSRYLAD